MKLRNACILMLCLLVPRVFGAAPDAFRDVDAALSKLNTGIELLEDRSPDALELIHESAADIRRVIDTHHIHTADIYHALGNAHMLLGEQGQAVLAYKRGERIDPTDPRLKDSLSQARAQVKIRVEPSTTRRLVDLLMSWRGIVPRSLLWGGFWAMFTVGWLLLTARVAFAAPRWFTVFAIWLLGVGLVPIIALAAEWLLYMRADQVVLTQDSTIARSGPDDSIYEPVYTEPLSAGVEATLLETRDGWAHLELANASTCWVPSETIEPVFPVPPT